MLFEIDQEEPKLKCRPINNRSIAEHPLLVPCALRFSAKATRGPAPGAHVLEPLHPTPDL